MERRPSFIRRWWFLLTIAAAGLVLLGAKLSVRSLATGEGVLPIAGAPALGPMPTATATPGPQRVRLRIQVSDVAGQPVSEAIVEVRDRFNGIAGQQETGSTGEVIVGLKADTGYVVIARKQGLAIGRVEGIDVNPPAVGPVGPQTVLGGPVPTPGPFRGQVVQVRLGPPEAPGGAASSAAGASGAPAVAGGRLFVGHSSPRLSVVDASSNLLQKHSEALGQGRLTLMAVSRDASKVFAAWFSAPELLVLNAYDLSVDRRVALNSGGITSLSVNPRDGRLWVATLAPEASESSVLHELDANGDEVLRRIPLTQTVSNLRFRPDGSLLYLPNRAGSSVGFLDPVAGAITQTARLPFSPTDLTSSPDGSRLYVINLGSSRVLEVDAQSGEQLRSLEVGPGSSAVAAHPDGKRLFIANQSLGFVYSVDLESGQVGDMIPVGRSPQGLAFSADATGLYVANTGSASISLVDIDKKSVRETLAIGGNPASLLLVRPRTS